jgi:Asp-tRNA(Asn)/Glu-tRNA(Gln) amidotransferase A subunit family amidase
VAGPLGSSPEDLALVMITATNAASLENNLKSDSYIQNFSFDVKLYKEISSAKNLRIGYFESLRTIETTPATRRAVTEAINAIRDLGH